jgi:hypothetical protein
MKNKLLASVILFFVVHNKSLAKGVNDLSPFKSETFDVKLKTFASETGKVEIFYSIKHNYTNAIICNVDIPVPVFKNNNEGIFEVSQADVVIFPNSAFNTELSYRIDSTKITGNVKYPHEQNIPSAASCHGWTLGKLLPQKACTTINPLHEQSCETFRKSGKFYYPLLKNDVHLGDCGC